MYHFIYIYIISYLPHIPMKKKKKSIVGCYGLTVIRKGHSGQQNSSEDGVLQTLRPGITDLKEEKKITTWVGISLCE